MFSPQLTPPSLRPAPSLYFGANVEVFNSFEDKPLSAITTKGFQTGIEIANGRDELTKLAEAIDDREAPQTLRIFLGDNGASANMKHGNFMPLEQTSDENGLDFAKRALAALKTHCEPLAQITTRRQTALDSVRSLVEGMLSAAASGEIAKGSKAGQVSLGGKEYAIEYNGGYFGEPLYHYGFSDVEKPNVRFTVTLNKKREIVEIAHNTGRGKIMLLEKNGPPIPITEQATQAQSLAQNVVGLLETLHAQKAYAPPGDKSQYGEPGPGETFFQKSGYPFPLD